VRPLVSNEEQVDYLADDTHDAIYATDQQRRLSSESNRFIEADLVVLNVSNGFFKRFLALLNLLL
jgi:hypothetical protein